MMGSFEKSRDLAIQAYKPGSDFVTCAPTSGGLSFRPRMRGVCFPLRSFAVFLDAWENHRRGRRGTQRLYCTPKPATCA